MERQVFESMTLCPIDGRYAGIKDALAPYFSEYALVKYRVFVEIQWLKFLIENIDNDILKRFDQSKMNQIEAIANDFDEAAFAKIKEIEATTRHDVKAVEYFLKEKFDSMEMHQYKEFIHFGLTSQDINNTSIPMSIKDALHNTYMPLIENMVSILEKYADDWNNIPMLAKTHGQPASPTRLGKEIRVFAYRLRQQLQLLSQVPISGKFGGATGNFNAHLAAYPQYDWLSFANSFLKGHLGIEREQWTTQISNYDNLGALFDALKRINTIIIDLDRDIWQYISMNYFKQKIKAGEVGSSAMPHKVNPIDFENSEGNLGIANAIFTHLSSKLPISRLQRDLTDSTVLRNVGVPLGHTVIAIHSTIKGLNKLILNEEAINADLDNMWNVVAEAIQTILRREGYEKPYETLKALTRTNSTVNAESISNFIDTLNVSDKVKTELKKITPHNYTGY